MPRYSTRIISDGGVLVFAMMLSNGLNFVYNAYLGRTLSFEEFGLVTLVNTFLFIASMFLGGFGSTINHRVAFLQSESGSHAASRFFLNTRKRALLVVALLTIIWILFSSSITQLFRVADYRTVLLFSPTFLLLVFTIAGRSYLQGTLSFGSVALIYLTESISKLVCVFLLVSAGYSFWAYLSIPISILITSIVCAIVLYGQTKAPAQETSDDTYSFPFSFYFASVFAGLSTTAFLSIDVLLAKHYLTPVLAGEYALLALVGKMVYFFGSLFNGFMTTFISRDLGKGRSPKSTFYMLFATSAFFALNSFAVFGALGYITLPLLLGDKSQAILPYVVFYSLGIALFTLSNTIVSYRTNLHHYVFPVLAMLNAVFMFVGIMYSHDSVEAVAKAVTLSSVAGFMIISTVHVLYDQGKFILRNLIDLFDLVSPVGNENERTNYKKRILIFNWRDIKHVRAGGAEVYLHELAKRWVADGYKVTLFCGNDGMCPRYEELDGIEIVRRGGFYFVYIWAFLYYIFKFRGKYDVIIDCENGIPFFTPLYTKEKQFLVIHHVHQEVFRKSLLPPFSYVAEFMESHFMPYVYDSVKIITVSPSSRQEIIDAGMAHGEVEIIYNGVDVDHYVPNGKSPEPTVLYLGRLKEYKSVDVFIKAAAKIIHKIPTAKFIVAGDGDQRRNLEKLADKLGIRNSIEFLGKVTEEMKVQLYQKSWIFVNPSLREGWGITTIEANACATPVVASRVSGLIDSVKNPHTGFLVSYGEVEAFAEKIELLLSDEQLRADMSSQAREWAQEFSWDKSAKKALEVLFV